MPKRPHRSRQDTLATPLWSISGRSWRKRHDSPWRNRQNILDFLLASRSVVWLRWYYKVLFGLGDTIASCLSFLIPPVLVLLLFNHQGIPLPGSHNKLYKGSLHNVMCARGWPRPPVRMYWPSKRSPPSPMFNVYITSTCVPNIYHGHPYTPTKKTRYRSESKEQSPNLHNNKVIL